MRVSRPDVAAAIDAQGRGTPLTGRLMRELEPVFRIAESGRYALAEGVMLNRSNVGLAVAQATLVPVSGIVAVSSAKDAMRADWRSEKHYDDFVSSALRRNRRDAFDAAHGADALGALVDPLWENLGMALTAVLTREHETFFDQLEPALAHDVSFGVMVVVAYAAGYAAHGDDARFEEMRGLVRLLPWAVPIGAPAGLGGRWLMLVA